MRRLAAWVFVGLMVGLAACGGGDKNAASNTTPNPNSGSQSPASPAAQGKRYVACDLLTLDEVSGFVGAQLISESPGQTFGSAYSDCEWQPGPNTPYTIRLVIGLGETYNILKQKTNASELSGVGDEAWISNVTSSGIDMGVRKGDNSILLDLDPAVTLDEAKQMVTLMFSRMT